jgi:hypothetical protein
VSWRADATVGFERMKRPCEPAQRCRSQRCAPRSPGGVLSAATPNSESASTLPSGTDCASALLRCLASPAVKEAKLRARISFERMTPAVFAPPERQSHAVGAPGRSPVIARKGLRSGFPGPWQWPSTAWVLATAAACSEVGTETPGTHPSQGADPRPADGSWLTPGDPNLRCSSAKSPRTRR